MENADKNNMHVSFVIQANVIILRGVQYFCKALYLLYLHELFT